jgi:hypothetical protein
MKNISMKPNREEAKLSGDIPRLLNAGASFQQELIVSPKAWNPAGLDITFDFEYLQVSR